MTDRKALDELVGQLADGMDFESFARKSGAAILQRDIRIAELEAENAALKEIAAQNFRWSYQLLLAFAKHLLARANAEREGFDWPAGQEWNGLVGTSHSIFLRNARDAAGINHDEYLEGIRDGTYDIDDLYNGR